MFGFFILLFLDLIFSIHDSAYDGVRRSCITLSIHILVLPVAVRRLHDLNYDGWWASLAIVPFANLWLWVMIGFISGSSGPNDFGDSPKRNVTQHNTTSRAETYTAPPVNKVSELHDFLNRIIDAHSSGVINSDEAIGKIKKALNR